MRRPWRHYLSATRKTDSVSSGMNECGRKAACLNSYLFGSLVGLARIGLSPVSPRSGARTGDKWCGPSRAGFPFGCNHRLIPFYWHVRTSPSEGFNRATSAATVMRSGLRVSGGRRSDRIARECDACIKPTSVERMGNSPGERSLVRHVPSRRDALATTENQF